MELAPIILTILIPACAYCVYYCHHLHLQLTDCKANVLSSHHPTSSEQDSRIVPVRREQFVEQGTSVWCQGQSNVERQCTFRNLCYSPGFGDFVFLHAPLSLYAGLPKNRHQPALADLSSVADHNTQYFHYVDVPSSFASTSSDVKYYEGKFLLFNRFNPGNLMHIFHDDLLPIFQTMQHLGLMDVKDNLPKATLLMNDGLESGEYFQIYEHFSQQSPVLTSQLRHNRSSALTCFEEIHVGLSKWTTWYQYGFVSPQGPLKNATVTSREIHSFTSYVKSKLGVGACRASKADGNDVFVILSRRSNRLILNEVEITTAIAQHFNAHVVVASLETHSLVELVRLISCAKGLVGMHGSLLALSIFLPSFSVLVEMFPYAVNPDNYTPYKTLAGLQGMQISYRAWRNCNIHDTVTHPDAQPEFGGISHLDVESQKRILASAEVPLHLCCNDPEWLFRIYQDTMVDVSSILNLIENASLEAQKRMSSTPPNKVAMLPGSVRNISCFSVPVSSTDNGDSDDFDDGTVGLLLSWQPPWNLASIQKSACKGVNLNCEPDVRYEVLIQEQGEGKVYAGLFVLSMTSHTFTEGFKRGKVYFAWIRCRMDSKTGPYTTITSCPPRIT
ncbi:protein O-linked-mannose beta-1,4-N-acetylglucosaminyltransferase 2-like [Diadema antillarum]|uniref:protein O-linked-mannose beta-1,4-N-acetylglucosaminyltransferase 2-like n=1 Tax=Diadema antillarum TaxID=105358 RepID=UPI003A83534E